MNRHFDGVCSGFYSCLLFSGRREWPLLLLTLQWEERMVALLSFSMVGYLQFAYGLINSCNICIIPHMEKSFYCHFFYFFWNKFKSDKTALSRNSKWNISCSHEIYGEKGWLIKDHFIFIGRHLWFNASLLI